MDMNMIVAVTAGFIIGWVLATALTRIWMHWTFREILKDLGITEQQLRDLAGKNDIDLPPPGDSLPRLEIRIEEVNGCLYAYRKDTDQFLAQGTDADQIIEHLKKNLTNVRVIVAKEDGAEYLTKSQGL